MAGPWDTPPTQKELAGSVWDAPPTETELRAVSPNAAPVAAPSGPRQLPDLGPITAIRSQLLKGMTKGGSDEAVAALFSRSDKFAPGVYLRLPDGTEVPVPTKQDAYRAGRDFLRQEQKAAQQHWPKLGFAAEMGGELLSDYALGGAKAAKRGYQTLSGLARGLMSSDAELTPGKITAGDAGSAGFSALLGGGIGNLAPVVVGRVAGSRPVQYLGGKLGEATSYAGNKVKDLAGWLKVNSLHPVPKVGEGMAAIPGGTPAVGRELLERGIGGVTKAGTAKQAAKAMNDAGAAIDDLVRAYDAGSGQPIDINAALSTARARAQQFIDEPTTEAVGHRLLDLVNKYQAKFSKGTATAMEALKMKRALGDEAYGAREAFAVTKDALTGNYEKGVAAFERALDDVMDKSIGPGFAAANLTFRRLHSAADAAKRAAARAQGNGLFDLKSLLAANAGSAALGGAGALLGGPTTGAAMWLGGKYGAQAGARSAYGLGSLLQSTPRVAGQLSQGIARGPAPQSAVSSAATRLRDLITQEPALFPTYALEDER